MAPSLHLCPRCACFYRLTDATCPHCAAPRSSTPSRAAAVLLAGLALTGAPGCPVSKYGIAPAYGVEDTSFEEDEDGDGWTVGDGDCDDSDAAIHPEAAETPGDGVDSNCNDEDDT